MKKLLLSFAGLIAFLVFMNLALLYVHTNTIKKMLDDLKLSLSERGLALSYEGLDFHGWYGLKLNSNIKKLEILKTSSPKISSMYSFEDIRLISNIKDMKITFTIQGKVLSKDQFDELVENTEYHFVSNPQLDVNLDGNFLLSEKFKFNETSEKSKSKHTNSSLQIIKTAMFSASGISSHNIDNNQPIMTLGEIKIKATSSKDGNLFDFDIDFETNDFKYVSDQKQNSMNTLFASLGAGYLKTNLIYQFAIETPGKEKLDDAHSLINSRESSQNDRESSIIEPSIDLLIERIIIKSFEGHNGLFGINLNGDIGHYLGDDFPFLKLKIQLNGYKELTRFYSQIINVALMSKKLPSNIAIKEDQVERVIQLLEEFAFEKKDDILIINLNRKIQDKLYISDKELDTFLLKLRSIFFPI